MNLTRSEASSLTAIRNTCDISGRRGGSEDALPEKNEHGRMKGMQDENVCAVFRGL